jgi:hypothetical protein
MPKLWMKNYTENFEKIVYTRLWAKTIVIFLVDDWSLEHAQGKEAHGLKRVCRLTFRFSQLNFFGHYNWGHVGIFLMPNRVVHVNHFRTLQRVPQRKTYEMSPFCAAPKQNLSKSSIESLLDSFLLSTIAK